MSIVSALEWIESTDISTAIREGALYYPIIGGVHLLGIALFGGMLLATDLRLLGWAMNRRRVSDVIEQFRNWKRLGFALILRRDSKELRARPPFDVRHIDQAEVDFVD